MKRVLLCLAAAIVLSASSFGQETGKIYSNSYLGKKPPEVAAAREHWLNAKSPISLKKLEGKVVWIEFSFIH